MSNKREADDTMLQQKIVAALADADIKSTDLSALIERTEAAIAEADQAAEIARSKALDPALSPDAKSAREAMVAAEFDRDRLHTLLPRLRERLQQVEAAEAHARWLAEYERVSTMIEKSVRRFAKYPELINELINLFQDAEAVDKEVAHVNDSAPDGEHRRLRQVELVARGLNNFSSLSADYQSGAFSRLDLLRSADLAAAATNNSGTVRDVDGAAARPTLHGRLGSRAEGGQRPTGSDRRTVGRRGSREPGGEQTRIRGEPAAMSCFPPVASNRCRSHLRLSSIRAFLETATAHAELALPTSRGVHF
jgi:predicted transcriptional regulator